MRADVRPEGGTVGKSIYDYPPDADTFGKYVADGLARSRAYGTKLGRPRHTLNMDVLKQMRRDGKTIREIASTLRCSVGLVHKHLRFMNKKRRPLTFRQCLNGTCEQSFIPVDQKHVFCSEECFYDHCVRKGKKWHD